MSHAQLNDTGRFGRKFGDDAGPKRSNKDGPMGKEDDDGYGYGHASNINSKSCITPETWQEMVGNMDKAHEGCTVDKHKTDHGYSFTATCKTSNGGSMVTTGSADIQDSERIVSQSHTDMTTNGKKRSMDMKSTSTFIGSDCGKVKPNEPETEDN